MDILGRITALREERGWSKNRLAKMSNLSQSTISNLYNRDYDPTFSTLESICAGFGISMAEFFNINGEVTHLEDKQKHLLLEWSKLTKEQRDSVLNIIKNMVHTNLR